MSGRVTKTAKKMTKAPYSIRPADYQGSWLTNDRQYFEGAHALLEELEKVVAEVNKRWPKPLGETVKKDEASPELWSLARKRDLLQDSVKIFSAMTVEAFLNFYGVVRLGQDAFESDFERLGPVAKLRKLIEVCDNVTLSDHEPIVQTLSRIAKRRNRLVHPRTSEVGGYVPAVDRGGDKVPDVARESVSDMVHFFQQFGALNADIAHHLPPPHKADTEVHDRYD